MAKAKIILLMTLAMLVLIVHRGYCYCEVEEVYEDRECYDSNIVNGGYVICTCPPGTVCMEDCEEEHYEDRDEECYRECRVECEEVCEGEECEEECEEVCEEKCLVEVGEEICDSECIPICSDECSPPRAEYRCNGDTVQKRTCGDYDDDPCYEWSPWQNVRDCNSDDTCDDGNIKDYYCSNGRCVERIITCPDTCSDSDCVDFFSKGRVIDYEPCSSGDTFCPYHTYIDYCIDEEIVKEYYCDEYEEYYCSGIDHAYSIKNCSEFDGWYLKRNHPPSITLTGRRICKGNEVWEQLEQEYRDYYCSNGACTYTVTKRRWVDVKKVEDCNSHDGWYGGGNNAGCGDDPASEYRDYYCSNGACTYKVTQTKDCDSSDICSGTCNPSTGDIEKRDYYVVKDSNICILRADVVEDCKDTCSDSDNGINLDAKGTVKDYNLCSAGQTSCPAPITKTDYCIDEETIREYYCSGNDYAYKDIYVGDGYICRDGERKKAVEIEVNPKVISLAARDAGIIYVTVKNLLDEKREIEIFAPELYASNMQKLSGLEHLIEEYSYKGTEVKSKKLLFNNKEEKTFEAVIKTTGNLPVGNYKIKFAVKSGKSKSIKGAYAEAFVDLNLNTMLIPIKIEARAYDAKGNPAPNILVKGFVCPYYVKYCNKYSALFWNETRTDDQGYFSMVINAYLALKNKYKVSVITTKGYAEAVFTT